MSNTAHAPAQRVGDGVAVLAVLGLIGFPAIVVFAVGVGLTGRGG